MKLFFRKYGEGKPVIILHGLFGQSDNWTSIARNLSEHGFSVLTADLRNHGLSGHSEDFSYQVMAEDLYELVNDELHKKPVVVGHSLGAKVILWFEYMFPGLASSLIPVDMAMRKYEPHHTNVLKGLNAVPLHEIKTRQEADRILSEYIPDAAVRQFLLKNLHRSDVHSEQLQWRFNLKTITEKYHFILEPVPEFHSDTPVFLIYGKNSSYVNEKDLQQYQRCFPNFSFRCVEDAGHWVHADQPAIFLQVLLEYLLK